MPLAFGDCELDRECFELRRRDRLVKIEPKVFDVLIHLIDARDRVVTKQELLDTLWPGEAVSDSVLPRCIAAIRRAVGDTRTRQRTIATVHGRGYRFVAELDDPGSSEGAGAVTSPTEASPATPAASEPAVVTQRAPPVPEFKTGSDFVGRAEGMQRLRSAQERAAAGGGGVTFVVGEPGIGKTRLTEEFAALAERDGFAIHVARCHEGEGAPVYWPWLQILRAAVAGIEDTERLRELVGGAAADLTELMPELATRLGDVPASGGPEGEQARFRLYDSATRFFVALASDRPLILVLDDLHWADASSLGLLRFLAGQIASAPILVVGTYRDVDVRRGHPLSDLLGALAKDPRCERLPLVGFDAAEIGTYVEGLTDAAPSEAFVSTMRDMTEGNPFFLREIVHLLAAQGDLDAADPGVLDSLRLPQGVRDAIGRRLDGLSPECNDALRSAAVLGRNFGSSLLATMLEGVQEGGVEELLELLAEALDAGLVQEVGRGQYAFAHALTRQTLYEELRAPQRTALHRRAGEALEHHLDAARAGDESLPELAHHFYEAAAGGDVSKSVAYSVAAAEAAHRRHAYDEAVTFHERAVEVAGLDLPIDEHRQAKLLLALGSAIHVAGRRAEAMATLERSARAAQRLEDWPLMAEGVLAIRGFGEIGTRPAEGVIELLEEALANLPEDELRLRSQLLARRTHAVAHAMEDRDRLSRDALECAERSGDPISLRDAWFSRWWATLGPDRIEDRFEVVRALSRLADRTGDFRTRMLALEVRLGAHLVRGDAEGIEATLAELERVADELRQPSFVFMAMNYRSSWLINQGRFEEAEALVEKAFAYGDGVVPFAAMTCMGQRYWSRQLRGDHIDHAVDASELIHLLDDTLMPEDMRDVFVAMIRYSGHGDAEGAREMFSFDRARALERDENWLLVMATIGEMAIDLGDREMVDWIYDAMLPYEELITMHDLIRVGRGAVAHPLGLFAVARGDLDAAVAHFERAIEIEDRARMRFARVQSELGLVGALDRRGGPGDARRAQVVLDGFRAKVAEMSIGEHNRLGRHLAANDDKNPFDPGAWRPIEAS